MLSGVNGASPWAVDASESASYLVEGALGGYSSKLITEWSPPDGFDSIEVASLVPDHPNVWSDGSLVLDQVTGVSSSGAGFFAHQSVNLWDDRRWGHVDLVRLEGDVQSCRGLEGWFQSWVPDSVSSAGGGQSVEAWYTTALDIEECLAGGVEGDVHLFVADVIKSFDTVDRAILDRVLSSLGLPAWFRHAYFEFHAHARLRFKLAAGLGEPWTRDGGVPQGCPLSMMFIVALYLPWCRFLAAQEGVEPQLYAYKLKCVSRTQVCFCVLPGSPLGMSRWLVRSLLVSTSRIVRCGRLRVIRFMFIPGCLAWY